MPFICISSNHQFYMYFVESSILVTYCLVLYRPLRKRDLHFLMLHGSCWSLIDPHCCRRMGQFCKVGTEKKKRSILIPEIIVQRPRGRGRQMRRAACNIYEYREYRIPRTSGKSVNSVYLRAKVFVTGIWTPEKETYCAYNFACMHSPYESTDGVRSET